MEQLPIEKENYEKYVKSKMPASPIYKNIVKAFIVGGIICVVGQGIIEILSGFDLSEQHIKGWTSVILIFIGSALTGIGIYDKLGKHAGAGSIIPITGFANSVVSSAMEFKKEGYIMGVGAKMFVIAGPVIVYGAICSTAYGIIFFIVKLIFT